jgi:release factor glutamine methyltransferase
VKGATAERSHRVEAVTVRDLLRDLADSLAGASEVRDPADEARDIVAALVDEARSWPALHGDQRVDPSLLDRARRAAAKRARGAPFAYCVGTAAFRHLTLEVDERVLIPRPETEQLVDVAMSMLGSEAGGAAIDVGTGSGAIALALATESVLDHVIGIDVSADALAVARRNADRLHSALCTRVDFRQGSLLAPVADLRPRLVVSNPPYIANAEAAGLPRSVRDWEPPVALLSGDDGLRVTARLMREAAERLAPNGAIVLEVDSRRASIVGEMARRQVRFTDVRVLPDLTGRERFVVARRKEEQ